MTQKLKRSIQIGSVCFCVILLASVVFLNLKSNAQTQELLEESIKSQLISISTSARHLINIDEFIGYRSLESMEDSAAYQKTLADLRNLANEVGAKYIYALAKVDGVYYFIFDTDPLDDELFDEYDLSPVHQEAFAGLNSASIMNVDDEWGSFNTGAVPLYKDGHVVGIISVDLEDTYVAKNLSDARRNMILLVSVLSLMLLTMLFVLQRLLSHIARMQEDLHRMAHYDKLTNLPNRQYLFDHLARITSGKNPIPFALFFVDLDNFKMVNDNAGHDAGDELLQHIALYLELPHKDASVFRPSAGKLNVTARIGGDKFIVIAPRIDNAADAGVFAQGLLDGFGGGSIDKYIEQYNVGLSIGVALFPYHTSDYNVLIKYADIAMYHSKHNGKNHYVVYDDSLTPKLEK